MNHLYGLIGYPLSHSWSESYFKEKFEKEKILNVRYQSFPLNSIDQFKPLVKNNSDLMGLNVTIPYKEQIIPLLDTLSSSAKEIGAVNTIKISRDGDQITTKGYNTDVDGFEKSLKHFQVDVPSKVLVLGTGGASKAVSWVLDQYNCDLTFCTRNPDLPEHISYSQLKEIGLEDFLLIINTTPLGMYPHIESRPDIPYHTLTSHHILFDLVYNPLQTAFLMQGIQRRCKTINGLYMLQQQAEKAWEIWNREG